MVESPFGRRITHWTPNTKEIEGVTMEMESVESAQTIDLCGKCGSGFLTLDPSGTKCFDCGHLVRPVAKVRKPRVDVGITPSPTRDNVWHVSLNIGNHSLMCLAYSEAEAESIVAYLRGVIR